MGEDGRLNPGPDSPPGGEDETDGAVVVAGAGRARVGVPAALAGRRAKNPLISPLRFMPGALISALWTADAEGAERQLGQGGWELVARESRWEQRRPLPSANHATRGGKGGWLLQWKEPCFLA